MGYKINECGQKQLTFTLDKEWKPTQVSLLVDIEIKTLEC